MKLTKKKIEELAYKILDFLTDRGIDEDVCIYFNDKRIRLEYSYKDLSAPPKLIVEENICPLKYFEYAAHNHILSMSFEGGLYDCINYGNGGVYDKLQNIFDNYGLYFELGNAWNLTAYPTNDDLEVEYTIYEQELIMLHIKFEYKDELSHGKWNKQECTVSSLEECIKIYGLGIDCEYRILSVEEIK